MATAQSRRPPPEEQPPPGARHVDDIALTRHDHEQFRDTIIRAFYNEPSALRVIAPLGIPDGIFPAWGPGTTAENWWTSVFREFDNGIVAEPYRQLLRSAMTRYGANRVLVELNDRYLTVPTHIDTEPEDTSATCHVIIRVSDEDERDAAAATLARLGLDPQELYSTEHAVSYMVSSVDAGLVRRFLGRTTLGWTVVAPGQPDYLLQELFVQGPDGSRFRFTDAPAAQTVQNIAAEVVGQYNNDDTAEAGMPTVADAVLPDGERRRLDMNNTLDEAGLRDGDSLRIGFEGRAGAINSTDQQDALDRVYHQMIGYANAHPGMTVLVNHASRPTEYEVEFTQSSFGPPAEGSTDGRPIDRHVLLIQLGPDFPVGPPSVYWLTPIFHPNVFPNYDSDQARRTPDMQGMVCLGMLAESWSPATDFGQVMQMLVAVAGYRNYDLFEFTGEMDAAGPQLRANFFDQTAAFWALTHQPEIEAIGGTPIVPRPAAEPGYPNLITLLDDDVDVRLG